MGWGLGVSLEEQSSKSTIHSPLSPVEHPKGLQKGGISTSMHGANLQGGAIFSGSLTSVRQSSGHAAKARLWELCERYPEIR